MVRVESFSLPPLPRREIARYARCPLHELPSFTEALVDECAAAARGLVCWDAFPIEKESGGLNFGFMKTDSADLAKNLQNCQEIILFAATVGSDLERLIRKYSAISPAKAVLCHAIGNTAIEAVCDAFCDSIVNRFGKTAPRFSPGYGDLPLDVQKNVFAALEPQRHIGLSIGENLMMTPVKSVTAIVGILEGKRHEYS